MPLFAFGSNGSGQLGIGHNDDVSVPTESHLYPPGLQSESPVCVTAGGNHTLVLYTSGKVTTTARKDSHAEPLLSLSSEIADNIKLCSATWDASILCSWSNRITIYGQGDKGELGHGDEICETPPSGLILDLSPILSRNFEIVSLASGLQHTVAVLSTGDVIGWGNGRKGQLGNPPEIVWRPRKIQEVNFRVRKAVCGREFTYLVGDSTDGKHLVLGSNKWEVRSNAPHAVPGWKDIGASWGSILVLFDSGSILSWGRHDHGQLAPQNLPEVTKFAAGSEHALVLSVDGRVLAWGWGEHGNCGSDTDDAGDVKGKWNVITSPEKSEPGIKGVGAGCATSWIWT